MKYQVINFKILEDERGLLTPIEGSQDIPFEIKRVFFIHGTKNDSILRGNHANRKSKFVLVMLSGSCEVKVYRENGFFETIILDTPGKGLFINNMVYKEMLNFSQNAVMLALSSEHYDETEYIDSYEKLLEELEYDKIS